MSKADSGILVPKFPVIRPEDISIDTLKSLSSDSFPMWCLSTGVKVDHNPVDFDKHRYLLPIYMDSSDHVTWQKAAQLGATSYMMLRLLFWLEQHNGRKAGLYMPTQQAAQDLSSDRLDPVINSAPSIAAIHQTGSKMSLRKFKDSSLYVYHLGGSASKDSIPLDFVAFDEVRLVSPKDIDQALERISHSPYKVKVFMSTSGNANDTIAARYNRGSQLVWRSACGCPDGVDLARTFPDCVVEDKSKGKLYLRCPKCKYTISDTQNGRYIPMNPSADYNSYHVSQLASKYISLKEIWNMYKTTTNMAEFYHAKLGLPYVDEDNRGVTMDQLKNAINPEAKWAVDDKVKTRTAMGIDQGGGYLMVVIMDVKPDGTKKRIRHVEIIERHNHRYFSPDGKQQSPFNRAAELMAEFNVGMCVVDGKPNWDDALTFAQKFPGRVYTAHYSEQKDTVVWGDKIKTNVGVSKAGSKYKFKYHVLINRFLGFAVCLGEAAQGGLEFPNPEALRQVCKDESTGQMQPEAVCWRLMKHMSSMIKQFNVTNEDTHEGRWIWAGPENDHLSHAALYANVALERLRRQAIYTFA